MHSKFFSLFAGNKIFIQTNKSPRLTPRAFIMGYSMYFDLVVDQLVFFVIPAVKFTDLLANLL